MESVSMQGSTQPYVTTLGAGEGNLVSSTRLSSAPEKRVSDESSEQSLFGKSRCGGRNEMVELISNIVRLTLGFVERMLSILFSAPGDVTSGAPGVPPEQTTPQSPGVLDPGCGGTSPTDPCAKRALQAAVDDAGQVVVTTEDGYTIKCEGKDQAWRITGPDGKTTRIWGDPHVEESDGDKWDFTDQSSFKFGNNKITVEVQPLGNGTSFTKQITIYNGQDRVTVSHIDENKPKITSVSNDGREHDVALSDGKLYTLQHERGSQEEEWRAEG